ncbi:alpha/beta hydrolase [Nitrospirillum sp. BR 11752]|uniref:alpha/beta hydrolase n=1 Tax=Nitrospirillum sp. BR 11752 TaxID=3104293 RepID=UPI002EB4C606|nr:alpha/beta hydrolase [Nitrospirillum sp. BR 11752]
MATHIDTAERGDNQKSKTGLARRNVLKLAGAAAMGFMADIDRQPAKAQDMSNGADNFYTSDLVTVRPVTFKNQYAMRVAGNLFTPKTLNTTVRAPAIVVGHPMGAVKEQSANLYATKMAERGFVTLSLDLSFWGASEGWPRNAVSPDIYAEDFSAAVDFLGTHPFIDRKRIGAIGICGSGSFVISAAKIDPRLKAIATVSMYDMGAANRNGLRHGLSLEQRKQIIAAAAEQRHVEFTGGEIQYTSGTVHALTATSTPVEREFYDFYRTRRGEFTPDGQSPLLTTHPTLTSNVKFMNFYPFNDIETISPRPLLFITGEIAHSREFSEDAYQRAAEPKELLIIPRAGHVDLYDRVNLIPFDKLQSFFSQHLAT